MLSTGAKAGVGITAGLVGAAIFSVLAWYVIRRRRRSSAHEMGADGGVHDENHEYYADKPDLDDKRGLADSRDVFPRSVSEMPVVEGRGRGDVYELDDMVHEMDGRRSPKEMGGFVTDEKERVRKIVDDRVATGYDRYRRH